jgi:uncharacterized membrane protein YfcA
MCCAIFERQAAVKTNVLWYLATGAAAGLLAGFLGIGGGVLLVPLMVGLFSVGQHRAHGTSLAIIVPIAIVGTIVYGLRGDVNWTLVGAIGAGSVLGAVVGAKAMMKVPADRLRQAFGVYTIVVAVLLLMR